MTYGHFLGFYRQNIALENLNSVSQARQRSSSSWL